MINFLLRKIFCGNLNEAISTKDITSFRFPRKIFLKEKSTFSFIVLSVRQKTSGVAWNFAARKRLGSEARPDNN